MPPPATLDRTAAALLLAALLVAIPARAGWPLPADAGLESYADPANWPSDPGYPEQWPLFGFTPPQLSGGLSAQEQALGVGAAVDRAWSYTRGDPRVKLAFLGAGVLWHEPELSTAWALSRGELPAPKDAAGQVGTGPDPWDLNGDGRFGVSDFTRAAPGQTPLAALIEDPRLTARPDRGDVNGNGLLDPQDLHAVFADGRDDDGNGYVDDTCGWDFEGDDGDPWDEGLSGGRGISEGTLDLLEAVARVDNGQGGAGVCPGCQALPVRVASGVLADPTRLAASLRYALQQGAVVTALPVQAMGAGAVLQSALDAAWLGGLLPVSAEGDAPGLRHDAPANLERTLLVRPLGPTGTAWRSAPTFLAADRCTPPGGHTALAVPTPRCGAGATALAAGIAGLLHSQALSQALTPPLLPGEVMQLLTRSAQQVSAGWSPQLGDGRVQAAQALSWLKEGRIPASVDLEEPAWFAQLPPQSPFPVRATISSRAPFTAVLEAAGGLSPTEAEFTAFAQVSAAGEFSGVLGTVDPARLAMPTPRAGDPNSLTLTLRLRVLTRYPDARGEVPAQARKSVYLQRSQELSRGYPRFIPGAGAASPRLIDLDNDGSDELVVATADGEVHSLLARGGQLPGFPIRVSVSGLPAAGGDGGTGFARQAIAATPAFEDLNEDGLLDLVVSTLEGSVEAFDLHGAPLRGFPVPLSDAGFLASPVVAPTPEGPLILQAGQDGSIHALRADGSWAAGFPLVLSRRLVATPAVADLDADGWPELVACGEPGSGETGAWAYLFHGGPQGPTLAEGWPVKLDSTQPSLEEEGAPSPFIADFNGDGRMELALGARHGPLRLFSLSGEPALELEGSTGRGPLAHPSAADLDGDGLLELVSADLDGAGLARLHVWAAGKALSSGSSSSPPLSGFPLPLSSLAQGAGFAVADIDGDSTPELLFGDGLHLFALNARAASPLGWPNFTGGSLGSTPTVGLAGGEITIAAATREGWVFAWSGSGFPEHIAWDGFHHDPSNSGFTGTPLPRRHLPSIGVPNPPLRPPGCCSGAPGPVELWAVGLLLSWLSTRSPKADS